ncbi:hypothetical protein TIFTF001_039600 [Ficus carica]|uniref:Cytochrome P450 n=1 Tax=Ficus carica TaxID=3494 RepID=A0AA88EB57_FICCA|nr:hypothetical protein TIFTF001_039600 [Ficus carica]
MLSGEVINVRTAAQHYPANALRRMMFSTRYFGKGVEDGGPGFEEEEHVSSFFTMLKYIYAFSVSNYLPWLRGLDLDGHQKRVRDAVEVVNKYHDPILNDRILQWREGKKTELEDVLDILISLQRFQRQPTVV